MVQLFCEQNFSHFFLFQEEIDSELLRIFLESQKLSSLLSTNLLSLGIIASGSSQVGEQNFSTIFFSNSNSFLVQTPGNLCRILKTSLLSKDSISIALDRFEQELLQPPRDPIPTGNFDKTSKSTTLNAPEDPQIPETSTRGS